MMLLPTVAALLLPTTLVAAFTPGSSCPPTELAVRLPPYLDPALNSTSAGSGAPCSHNSSFVAPPTGFFAGTWSIRNTSATSYRAYGNLQWDLTPAMATCEQNTTSACPAGTVAGVINELTSWAPADNKTGLCGAIGGGGRELASVRAYNTPRRLKNPSLDSGWDAVFDNSISQGPATGYHQTWSVIYWGLDALGLPFMVVHEAPAEFATGEVGTPAVHAISINPAGADEASLTKALEALIKLGNEEVTAELHAMGATKWNDELLGGPAICGPQCQRNEPMHMKTTRL